MRGTSDRSDTFPFSVAPAGGWGHPNPTGEYVVADASVIGKAIKIEGDGYARTAFAEATRFPDAAAAAIASGNLAKQVRQLH